MLLPVSRCDWHLRVSLIIAFAFTVSSIEVSNWTEIKAAASSAGSVSITLSAGFDSSDFDSQLTISGKEINITGVEATPPPYIYVR